LGTSVLDADAVRLALDDAESVEGFLGRRTPLEHGQCIALLNEAISLFEGLYVHLPSKKAIYAADPVRRLQLLRLKMERPKDPADPPFSDLWFHREMVEAFTSVRDLHTAYVLPPPFDRALAFVPFQIETCHEDGAQLFVVSNVIEGLGWFEPPSWLVPGVRVTHWNDIPMPRALAMIGAQNAGSNPTARLARGLARLTIRPLARALPPDEEFVTLRCVGRTEHLRVPWRVVTLPADQEVPEDDRRIANRSDGLDHEGHLINQVKRPAFSRGHQSGKGRSRLRAGRQAAHAAAVAIKSELDVDDSLRDIIQASIVTVDGADYGYIRIRSFNYPDDESFLSQMATLVEQMPGNGLMLDIRDNPGGVVLCGERSLQLLTPRTIQPVSAQFINSPLSLAICDLLPDFAHWRESMHRALETGAMFSAAFPLSDPDICNDTGQRYYGPSVLIINGLCFSTADIFSAGFQDHAIGVVLGTDERTGAGGADVKTHSALCALLAQAAPDQRILAPLTAGDLRIAFRRILRVGPRAGTELEDIGVSRDEAHEMTPADVLSASLNGDLIRRAVGLLKARPGYDLREEAAPVRSDGGIDVAITTRNIDRIDAAVDDKWSGATSVVTDGSSRIRLSLPAGYDPTFIRLRGFWDEKLVASRKILL
jgi:hypothetical protein